MKSFKNIFRDRIFKFPDNYDINWGNRINLDILAYNVRIRYMLEEEMDSND